MDSKRVGNEQPEERLIVDRRAGLTPVDIVEQRLRSLLRCSTQMAGGPQFCLPRGNQRSKRTIDYPLAGGTAEGTSRTDANRDREKAGLYAISIEQTLATEILTGLQPALCCFWRTDHRGLLLIHSCTRKPAKGASLSSQGAGRNALVGVVELADCITSHDAGFDPDETGFSWVLVNPRLFTRPLPYPGRTGLFLVSQGVVAAALKQVRMPKQPRGC
jgi:hypothetical protein